ncbi:MAG: crossover junction endodeoxyribonuclease RuvC [Planctomycetota bacterium]
MRVVGIDPGLRITGYACVDGDPESIADPSLVEAGVFRLVSGAVTPSLSSRLVELEADVRGLLDRLEPDTACVEGLFAHYKHPATAVAMAHARGVILLALEASGVGLVELKPAQVKLATVGAGRATKRQMQMAVAARFGLSEPPEPHDVADAMAIALAGLRRAGKT